MLEQTGVHAELRHIVVDGPLAVVGSRAGLLGAADADIFRIKKTKVVEHWDVQQYSFYFIGKQREKLMPDFRSPHADSRPSSTKCRTRPLVRLALTCGCLLTAAAAPGAEVTFRLPPGERIASPAEPGAIDLYEGAAPGSVDAGQREVWEQTAGGREARNVTEPVLLPVLPLPGKANGTAIIIAPGGGFRGLSMDNEGFAVAHMLAAEGVTAFVLKYRLIPTPPDRAKFAADLAAIIERREPLPTPSYAVDDGRRAVRLVRERAAAFGVRTDRVGMIGFSAGARLTLEVSLSPEKVNRPDFAGIIYGPMSTRSVPAGAPPAFMALASDDSLAAGDYGIVGAWQKAGSAVEFHLYGAGGHGFGMSKRHTTSDLWASQLLAWLRMRGQI